MTQRKMYMFICLASVLALTHTYASNSHPENNFFIIPKVQNSGRVAEDVKYIGDKAGNVTNRYREISEKTWRSLAEQISSGVMSRDTLLQYVVYLIRFVSQIGILVGAIWIIIAGYKYAVAVFNGGDTSEANDNIKNAIIGVVIIAMSYGFMKILTNAFL